MSERFFTIEKEVALREEIQSWIGTPFLHGAKVKRVGVDCVHLVAELMKFAGVIDSYKFGYYGLDWSQHQDESLLLKQIHATGRFTRIEADQPPRFGDIAMFTVGRCVHHCGLMVSPMVFVHVLSRGRVCYGRLDDPTWSKRLDSFYRADKGTVKRPAGLVNSGRTLRGVRLVTNDELSASRANSYNEGVRRNPDAE